MTKKPEPVLEMLFEGPGVLPEAIPLGSLSQALSAVQRLASGKSAAEEEEDENEADDSLRLFEVRRGSAVFRITGPSPEAPLANIQIAGRVMRHPEEAGDSDYVIGPIENLSRIARNLKCEITLRKPGQARGVLMKVDGASYGRIAGTILVTGETSFAGKVERVGGATENRCALRVSFQPRMVYCSVDNIELARKLGENLYQNVVVQGTATWVRGSWKILSFAVSSMYQPKKRSIRESFQALHEAGGKGWDKIDDPDTFIEEVSGQR
jgi:hypothetical protein